MATSAELAASSVHIEPGLVARKWERFIVNKAGIIMSVCPGLSGLSPRSCQVVDISRGGARIQLFTTIGLPDHYYLSFAGLVERIGCAEVYRGGGRVDVRFIKTMPEGLISTIVRGDFLSGGELSVRR